MREEVFKLASEFWVMGRGMDEDEYEDYLVDKAKELLNEQLSEVGEEGVEKPEMKTPEDSSKSSGSRSSWNFKKRNKMDERAEKDSTSKIPFTWDPQEVEHLTKNRHHLDNEEMKKFLEKDTEFQEKLQEIDEWHGFSRWEERFLVQNPETDPEELADELGRETDEVEIKMHMLGIRSIK